MQNRLWLVVALVAGFAVAAMADARLPKIFTDNMVLQRDRPIRVWGWAEPGEAVRVALAGKDAVILPDNDGPGQAHAALVAHSLVGKARTIKAVHLQEAIPVPVPTGTYEEYKGFKGL